MLMCGSAGLEQAHVVTTGDFEGVWMGLLMCGVTLPVLISKVWYEEELQKLEAAGAQWASVKVPFLVWFASVSLFALLSLCDSLLFSCFDPRRERLGCMVCFRSTVSFACASLVCFRPQAMKNAVSRIMKEQKARIAKRNGGAPGPLVSVVLDGVTLAALYIQDLI
jgi:hypothetical protein